MSNRLVSSSSPYLRQHADNPVEWWEWDDDAFAAAHKRDVPVFLSVGYAACHWCHVMAHESFGDPDTAALLNRYFVNVKVDREQRPDVDEVYMAAVQAMAGQGGWPMSVFLTPDGIPFYAGTYFPPQRRGQMPSFKEVVTAVHQSWQDEREGVQSGAARVAAHLAHTAAPSTQPAPVTDEVLNAAADTLIRRWDRTHGGFGTAPKFPHGAAVEFLLAAAQRSGDSEALQAAVHTLDRMARGGIRDHVGGGFARYSTDEKWLVPHFEKMLYDNATLLRAYTRVWHVTSHDRFAAVADELAEWLIGMQHPEGGFASSVDADSDGVEGLFYVWTADEFDDAVAAVGENPRRWRVRLGVTDEGNVHDPLGHAPPGANVLSEVQDLDKVTTQWAALRQALHERRNERPAPAVDDKVLTSWNALAIAALAEAGTVFDKPEWVNAAVKAATFIQSTLTVEGGLAHTWSPGHAAEVPALAEDVALLASAALALYQATFDPEWVSWAIDLAETAETTFADGDGAYYTTPLGGAGGPNLPIRTLADWDATYPSATSAMVGVHIRLFALTGQTTYRDRADATLGRFSGLFPAAPLGYGEMLIAAEAFLAGPTQVAIIVPERTREHLVGPLIKTVQQTWHPGVVVAVGTDDQTVPALLSGRRTVDGKPTAYVCHSAVCDAPTTDAETLLAQLSPTP